MGLIDNLVRVRVRVLMLSSKEEFLEKILIWHSL